MAVCYLLLIINQSRVTGSFKKKNLSLVSEQSLPQTRGKTRTGYHKVGCWFMDDAPALPAGPIRFVVEPYNGTLPRLRYDPNSWTKVIIQQFF